jgi:hypothetical protein
MKLQTPEQHLDVEVTFCSHTTHNTQHTNIYMSTSQYKCEYESEMKRECVIISNHIKVSLYLCVCVCVCVEFENQTHSHTHT